MKKIFTFIIATCSMVTGFAQWQQRSGPNQYPDYPQQNNNYNQYSSLIISSGLLQQLTVSVDNYQYQVNSSNGNGSSVNVGQLQAGNHNVVITQWRRNFLGKQVQEVIYNSTLYFKPGYETNIFVDGYGRTNISDRQIYANNNQGGYNNNGNGVGNGYGRKKNKHKKNNCDNDDYGNNQWNRNDRRGDDNNEQYYDSHNYNRKAMDRPAFEQLKQSIARESFDNTKLKIAKQFITVNYFNTAQVKELVDLFIFENNKLEIAKYAYDYTVDKGNYFLVNDAFSFSNSKEALMDYIKNRT